jgi:hypothetical protein
MIPPVSCISLVDHKYTNPKCYEPVPVVTGPPTTKNACKQGGWKTFNNPSFKNQGQCVSYVNHHSAHGKSAAHKLHTN